MINQNFSEGLSAALENWINLSEENKKEILQHIYNSIELLNYPFYESDSIVTLVYKGNCQKVALLSDITGWTDPIPFKKLNGTDLFFLKLELEPDARIQYLLIVDGNAICDPINKYKPINGLGSHSELAMSGYMRHHYHNDFLYGKEGSYEGLIKHTLTTSALPYDHEVHIFLPPAYTKKTKYPTVYFHDGPDYIRFGLAAYTINRLIVEKYIEPCIAIFVTPPNLHQPAEPNRSTEYGMNDKYVKFFCDELVNFIDSNYSTLRLPQERLVVGDSYAGLISLYIALSRTDAFANVYSQSGYFSFNNDRIIKLIDEHHKKPIKLYLDIGTYEEKVGADFLPSTELDFTSANRRMKRVLTEKDYDFIYREYHEGHTWGNWRRHLIDALIYFYAIREK